MPPFPVRDAEAGASFAVRVQPGAKREGVVGVYGDALKVAINAPAVDGKANDALVAFLADFFGVPRRSIAIVAGHLSRSKTVRVLGLTASEVQQAVQRSESC